MKNGAGRRAAENGPHRHSAKSAGREKARRREQGGQRREELGPCSVRGRVDSRGQASRVAFKGRADFKDRADFRNRAGRAAARAGVVRGLVESGQKGDRS